MHKIPALIVATAISALLAGCGSGGGLLNRDRPDEMAVQRQAPLVVPPDFVLTPPAPGAPTPVDRNMQQQTIEALFGGPAPRSEIEKSTIGRAGTSVPGIRSNVGDPDTYTVNKGDITRQILAAPQGDGREARTSTGA